MNYLEEHKKIFGCEKPIIGCLHLLPLPGTPYYNEDTTIEKNIERLKHDAKILMENGVDAVVFANEGDRPYLTSVGPEVIAAYVRVVTEILPMIHVPYGCGCLIDPIATLAIAKAIGAKFIRTYVTNSYEGTFGHQEFSPAEVFRYRHQIDADDVHVYTYFDAHAGVCLDTRPIEAQISSGLAALPISGILVGGPRAGLPPETSAFANVKKAFPDIPLILGSGANKDNIADLMPYCDGLIVGTTTKRDKYLYNEMDLDRAKEFITAAKAARK